MNERALRYFLQVVKLGSVRRAAEQLNVAASAVSRHIGELEATFKVPLLERLPRGVAVTEAGRIVAEHAQRAVENLESLDDRLRRFHSDQEGNVRIACGSGWMGDLMENGLQRFIKVYPNINWRVSMGTTSTIQEAIVNGDFDIGLLYNPPSHESIRTIKMQQKSVHALLHRNHTFRIPEGSQVYLKQISHIPAAVLPKTHGVRKILSQIEANEGFNLNIKLETDSANLKLKFALAGLGMLLSPMFAGAVEYEQGQLKAYKLADTLLVSGLSHLIVRAGRRLPDATQHVAEFLSANLAAFRQD